MGTILLVIYFIYGLAFWALGLAVLLESGRVGLPSQVRSLHWLSAFGILHGSHEWLEAYLLGLGAIGASVGPWLVWFRLGLLTVSFGCLSASALAHLSQVPHRRGRLARQLPLATIVGLSLALTIGLAFQDAPVQWAATWDAASRYILAVPAALLAAVTNWPGAGAEPSHRRAASAASLRLAALGFAGYAAAQLFVHRLPWFPANVINQESLLAATGLPIQAVRAVMAVLISTGLLRAMQVEEADRQRQLAAAHQARLAALEQQDALRRDLLRHVVRSQEDERARIARELHDEAAQLLSALSLQLGSLRAKVKRDDAAEILDRLENLARQMSESLFHLVRNLRPSHLDNLGLVPALKFLLSQDYGPRGLDVTFHVVGHARPLESLIDTALFRIAQEALTNIVRHANVSQAVIEVMYGADRITLRICDQGRGFEPDGPFNPPRGWGLAGMRERVEALGGQLDLRSAPSRGTTVQAVIPLAPHPQEDITDD